MNIPQVFDLITEQSLEHETKAESLFDKAKAAEEAGDNLGTLEYLNSARRELAKGVAVMELGKKIVRAIAVEGIAPGMTVDQDN